MDDKTKAQKLLETISQAEATDPNGEGRTYTDANFLKYAHEPEFKAAVKFADQPQWGLGWEVGCEYATARDRGESPREAAFAGIYEWDLCDISPDGIGLVLPPEASC